MPKSFDTIPHRAIIHYKLKRREMDMEMYLGDRVRWTSAAGDIRGEIVDITIGPSAATKKTGKLQVWITVQQLNGRKIQICGSDDYLKALKFKVTFRDKYAS